MLRFCSRALVLLLLAAGAHAQTLDDAAGQGAGSLDLERWRPGLDGNAILDVESADVGDAGDVDAAAHLGYAHAPMTGAIVDNGARTSFIVVDHRLGANLTGAMTLLPRFKLGFDLPLVLLQTGPASIPGLTGQNPVALLGTGDLRAVGKYGLLRRADGAAVDLALVGHLTLPTSLPRHQYIGDGLPTLAAEVAVSRDEGALRWAVNVGPKLRVPSTFGPAVQGQELGYRAAVSWDDHALPVGLDASLNGAALLFPATLSTGNNPLEVLVGVHRDIGDLQIFGGVGAGVPTSDVIPVGGVGAPLFRVQTGVRYMPRCNDDDGDGLCRSDDKCPDQAEDKDGFDDADGCPDADNDGDGIADSADKCPAQAEDKDGFDDADGCPDTDNDGDGIADTADKCPDQAEDKDGDADDDGCPDVTSPASLTLGGSASFATASAKLRPAAQAALKELADKVKAAGKPLHIRVEGHTDDTATPKTNNRISQARADAVKAYLIELGVPAASIEAKGFGEDKPKVPNDSDEHRAQNRRVDVIVDG